MKFSLQFDMDNAAFEDNPNEFRELLVEAASFIYPYVESNGALMDSNGNTIGEWRVEE